jgi:hypothetical protein
MAERLFEISGIAVCLAARWRRLSGHRHWCRQRHYRDEAATTFSSVHRTPRGLSKVVQPAGDHVNAVLTGAARRRFRMRRKLKPATLTQPCRPVDMDRSGRTRLSESRAGNSGDRRCEIDPEKPTAPSRQGRDCRKFQRPARAESLPLMSHETPRGVKTEPVSVNGKALPGP